jgi:hypothetical protein
MWRGIELGEDSEHDGLGRISLDTCSERENVNFVVVVIAVAPPP